MIEGIDEYLAVLRVRYDSAPSRSESALATAVELAFTLADRYGTDLRREGDLDALVLYAEEAIAGLPPVSSDRAALLFLAGEARSERFFETRAESDRDTAIGHLLAALDAGIADLVGPLTELAWILGGRSEEDRREEDRAADLDAALGYARRALELADRPVEPRLLRVLGLILTARADRHYEAEEPDPAQAPAARADLDAAIAHSAELLARLGPAGPDWAAVAEELGDLHYTRFFAGEDPDLPELDRAVEHYRLALPGGTPWARFRLGTSLADRFAFADDPSPVDAAEAVELLTGVLPELSPVAAAAAHRILGDQALDEALADPPLEDRTARLVEAAAFYQDALCEERGPAWNGLVSGLLTLARWHLAAEEGTPERIDALVESGRTAWRLLEPGEDRLRSGMHLGVGLLEQLPRLEGDDAVVASCDLQIEIWEEVLPGIEDDPDLLSRLSVHHATALACRSERIGSRADLVAAGTPLYRGLETVLGDDPPDQATLRNLLLSLIPRATAGVSDQDAARAEEVLRILLSDPGDENVAWLTAQLGQVLTHRITEDPSRVDEAIDVLRHAFDMLPSGSPDRLLVVKNLIMAVGMRFNSTGDHADLESADGYRRLLRELAADKEASRDLTGDTMAFLLAEGAGSELIQAIHRRDHVRMRGGAEDLRRALAALPVGHPHRTRIQSDLGLARATSSWMSGDPDAVRITGESLAELDASIDGLPADSPLRPVLLARKATLLSMLGTKAEDPARLQEAITLLDEAVSAPAAGTTLRVRAVALSAVIEQFCWAIDRRPERLRSSIVRAESVIAEPFCPPALAADLEFVLATSLRELGKKAEACGRAMDSLARRCRAILMQTGSQHALIVAKSTAAETRTLVDWCLSDGDPRAAIAALELSRGLVLHAATVAAGVPDMLLRAGRADLAEQWRAAPPPEEDVVPVGRDLLHGTAAQVALNDGLRYRAMEALAAAEEGRRLFTAPTPDEIALALTETGTDALVYLIPPTSRVPGTAVMVTAGAEVETLPVPLLSAEFMTHLDRYIADHHAYLALADERSEEDEEAEEALYAAEDQWLRSMTLLCDRAWIAVMKEVTRTAERLRPGGRVPRLTLVPVGRLGAVPWHAASSLPRGGGRRRYACERLVVSYAATGRQFIDVARRPVLPLRERPLIVANPPGPPEPAPSQCVLLSLPYSQYEGEELRARFYREARYFGLPVEGRHGPGVPAEVEEHLPSADRPGASMMHFGCHALTMADETHKSGLVLAGGQRLLLGRLLQAAYGRDPSAPGGTVFLAACTSDFARADYDEVLTPATSFIAMGATSVVGARWIVPDDFSALFAVRYHEFLASGASPRDALHKTQLWMLNPDREIPEDLREPALRMLLTDPDPEGYAQEDLLCWAGFTHQGR